MKDIYFYTSIAIVGINILSFIFLFCYFGINKRKYEKVIEMYYKSGFELYVPYYFHSLVGFFGSFTLVYYFLCLKKHKKPLVMYYKNPDVYNFFNTVPEELTRWMNTYYRVTLICLYCTTYICSIGFARIIYLKFIV